MKTPKKVISTTVLILMVLFSYAQNQEKITLVSSKNLNGANTLFVDLYGKVQTESWDKDFVRIILEIKTKGVTREVVKHLVSKKRFYINSYKTDQTSLKLSNPNISLPVYINGRQLKEDINYKLYIPHNAIVIVKPEDESSNTLAIAK